MSGNKDQFDMADVGSNLPAAAAGVEMTWGLPTVLSAEGENPYSRCPWLLFKHEIGSGYLSLYNAASHHTDVKEIMELKDTYICGSSHGWLVMIDATTCSDCFLFNPFTLEKIKLPPREPPLEPLYVWCILSSPPTTSRIDHESPTVVFLEQGKSCISFCRVGEMEWKQVADTAQERLRCFTICKDQFYFLNSVGSLFLLEFGGSGGENARLTRLIEGGLATSILLPESEALQEHLIESCGNLYAVVITVIGTRFPKIGAIEVFKMDFAKLKWVQAKSLGDFSFFIRRFSSNSISRSASKAGLKANSIYFIDSYDMYLYRYDMEKRRINPTLPCPNLEDLEWEDIDNHVPFWL